MKKLFYYLFAFTIVFLLFNTNNFVAEVDAASCLKGEQKLAKEDICALPVTCKSYESCLAWSEKLLGKLIEEHESLVEWYVDEWDYEETETHSKSHFLDGVTVLTNYSIKGNKLIAPKGKTVRQVHQDLWNDYRWLIPYEERSYLSKLEIFSSVDTAAYAMLSAKGEWVLGIERNRQPHYVATLTTMIHEFAHFFSFSEYEVDPNVSKKKCPRYFDDFGCFYADSYLNEYYQSFWKKGASKKSGDYVSEYAMNDIKEDFAETFAYFVLTPQPTGNSVVDQKILFFYQYENLVELRADILARVATWLERQ